jgi:hypothetical protein
MTPSSTKEIQPLGMRSCPLRKAVRRRRRRRRRRQQQQQQQHQQYCRPISAVFFAIVERASYSCQCYRHWRLCTVSETSWIIFLVTYEAKVNYGKYVQKCESFSIDRY